MTMEDWCDTHHDDIRIEEAWGGEDQHVPQRCRSGVSNIRRKLTPFEVEVLRELDKAELRPYVYVAAVSGSLYIKFHYHQLRSLRIANHKVYRGKYRYKWNLRKNYPGNRQRRDGNVMRYFYKWTEYKELVKHMKNYLNKIIRDGNLKDEPKASTKARLLWSEEEADIADEMGQHDDREDALENALTDQYMFGGD